MLFELASDHLIKCSRDYNLTKSVWHHWAIYFDVKNYFYDECIFNFLVGWRRRLNSLKQILLQQIDLINYCWHKTSENSLIC